MSSADKDVDEKREIPGSSRGFVNIANISALDLLEVEANHNGITTDPNFVDKDRDGIDDRDEYAGGHQICKEFMEAVASWVADVVHNLLFGSALDSVMNDRASDHLLGRRFNSKGLISTAEQRRVLDASGHRLEDAIVRAKADPSADNFLNLCDARMERKIAATDMIMNDARTRGDTATYEKARTMEEKFRNIRHDITVVQQKAAGEPDEAKKQAEIKTLMPTMWERFQNGELTTEDGGVFNAWQPSNASNGNGSGITQPFWNTLSGLFKLAGFHLPQSTPAANNVGNQPSLQLG